MARVPNRGSVRVYGYVPFEVEKAKGLHRGGGTLYLT